MSLDALPLDTVQELRHSARSLAHNADIMYSALAEADMPDRVVEEAFLIWWKICLTPGIQMPDFSALLGSKDDDDE